VSSRASAQIHHHPLLPTLPRRKARRTDPASGSTHGGPGDIAGASLLFLSTNHAKVYVHFRDISYMI
jgi:hypothetical protein